MQMMRMNDDLSCQSLLQILIFCVYILAHVFVSISISISLLPQVSTPSIHKSSRILVWLHCQLSNHKFIKLWLPTVYYVLYVFYLCHEIFRTLCIFTGSLVWDIEAVLLIYGLWSWVCGSCLPSSVLYANLVLMIQWHGGHNLWYWSGFCSKGWSVCTDMEWGKYTEVLVSPCWTVKMTINNQCHHV